MISFWRSDSKAMTLLTPFFPYSVFNNIHLSERTSVCKELSGSHSVDDGHELINMSQRSCLFSKRCHLLKMRKWSLGFKICTIWARLDALVQWVSLKIQITCFLSVWLWIMVELFSDMTLCGHTSCRRYSHRPPGTSCPTAAWVSEVHLTSIVSCEKQLMRKVISTKLASFLKPSLDIAWCHRGRKSWRLSRSENFGLFPSHQPGSRQ